MIYACGLYSLAFALFHIGFWRIFSWTKELKKLSFANKGIMQILNVQIVYYFIFVALMCFIFPSELITTRFGNVFLIGNSLFWLIRTIQQPIFFSINNYKIHLLTIIFLVGFFLFALPVLIK